jgi:tetratricopeptide (TPR) repeat protein
MIPQRHFVNLLGPGAFLVAAAFFLFGCSLPRIIVLHDPLAAVEHDNLGRIYESQGKPDLALEQYREALRQDPKHVPSLLLLGDLLYKTKDYRGAESSYTKALKLDPKNGDVRNNLAWVYIQTGTKLDKAKELVSQALDLNPANRPFYLDTLGVILLRLGNVEGAIAALKESVDTIPKDRQDLATEAQQHLTEAYKSAGDDAKKAEAPEKQDLQN